MRYRITALAATSACMDVYMRSHRKLGPLPPPVYHFHPVEVVIGEWLSVPLFPAQIEERPHPLWLGMELVPPRAGPVRLSMREWMREVAQQVNPELGDAANALRGAHSRGAMVRFA